MNTYTPDDTNNPTSFTEPDDGDNENVTSILPFVQGLADKAAHMNLPEQLPGTGFAVADQTIRRVGRLPPEFNVAEWSKLTGQPFYAVIGTSAVFLTQTLEFQKDCTTVDVTLYVDPGTGHSGVLGADAPTIQIYEVDVTAGTMTPITVAVVDPTSGSLVTYETPHGISTTFTYSPDVVNKKYVALLLTEGGVNALAGFRYNGYDIGTEILATDIGAC